MVLQKVTVAIGPDKGRVFNLSPGEPIHIGRRHAHVLLTDHNISRKHAQFLFRDDKWWVIDLGSTNGTSVNGIRVTQAAPLKGGDQIQLGRSTLIFHGAPASQRKARPDTPVGGAARQAPPVPPAATPPPPAAVPVAQADDEDPDNLALDVISGRDESPVPAAAAIERDALQALEQHIEKTRAETPKREPAPPPPADQLPKPKPVPSANMGQTADHEAPTLNVTTVNVKAPQPAEPSQQSIEPQPKPVAVPPQSAEPPPQSPLVADQVQQVSAPPVGTDEIDLVPPADAEPPVFDAVAALDPPISEVDDFELDSQPISVAPSEPSVEETETAPEPERPAINPSRILAAPMIEFDVDTQNHHRPDNDDPQPAESDIAHFGACLDDELAFSSLSDELSPSMDELNDPSSMDELNEPPSPSHEAPADSPTGTTEHDTDDDLGAVDPAGDRGQAEEHLDRPTFNDETIDPLHPRDVATERAFASATSTNSVLVDPAQEADASPIFAATTLALAVEIEPSVGIVPPDEEEELEDDLPRPAPPPVAQTAIEVEPPPVVEPPEPEQQPAEPEAPLRIELEPEADADAAIEAPPPPHPTEQPEPREPTSVRFSRRPATPGASGSPSILIEPEPETQSEAEFEEEYDYYAWEERQRQARNRKLKIAVVSVIVALALGTNLMFLWREFFGTHPTATAPPAVTPVTQTTPKQPPKPEPGPVVDPLDKLPQSGEDRMSNVLSAMQKQVEELDKADPPAAP